MQPVIGFLAFCYDFIVGEAWEVALGVVVALVLAWLLTHAGGVAVAWLVLPIGILLALGVSLTWAARAHLPDVA